MFVAWFGHYNSATTTGNGRWRLALSLRERPSLAAIGRNGGVIPTEQRNFTPIAWA
jgi:hypothetical protein